MVLEDFLFPADKPYMTLPSVAYNRWCGELRERAMWVNHVSEHSFFVPAENKDSPKFTRLQKSPNSILSGTSKALNTALWVVGQRALQALFTQRVPLLK